jgi:excisionase family DNA binding protein
LANFGKNGQLPLRGDFMNTIDGEILTLEQVAAFLKASKKTVYRLAQNGEVPAFKLGGSWRFRKAELDKWIANQIGYKDRT